MNKDDIKDALTVCANNSCSGCLYYEFGNCYDKLKLDARDLITEQEKEIERLKDEDTRLTEKLKQVLLAVDTVKEMTAMCNIDKQNAEIERLKAENEELTKVVSSKVYDLIDNTKEIADAREALEQQAKIEVLNELKEKCKFDGHTVAVYKNDIEEMIEELQNAKNKS